MKKLLIVAIVTTFLVSCKKEQEHYPHTKIKGLASPAYLPYAGGDVLLTDYFLEVTQIDSIETNKHYEATLSTDKKVVTFKVDKNTPQVSNLRVWTNGIVNDIPLFKSNLKEAIINIPDKTRQYKDVKVKGEFSNWQQKPLVFENGTWSFRTKVNPGNHQYVLVVDGKEQPDVNNPNTISNGMGGTNSVLKIETHASKLPQIEVSSLHGNSFKVSSKNPVNHMYVYIDNLLHKYYESPLGKTEHSIELPVIKNMQRGHVRIYASNEFGKSNDVLIPLEKGTIVTDASALKRTDFHTQIMYFLMVDRFVDGDTNNTKKIANDSIHPKANYYGGDLQGVVKKIKDGYFSKLGINTIWLSPITQNPEGAYGLYPEPLTKFSGYHGYWPISSTKIDYRFGAEAVLKELIDEAHSRNMNVILDYVANHVHKEHPVYQQHPDWATNLYLPDGSLNTERWDEHRLTTWFDVFMPTLDFSKPEVVEKMTDSAAYWVTNYNLDGFRHDATKHIQLEFWRTLTKKVKERTNRPIYQIGETYGSPDLIRSYVNTGMLDGQFDFNLYDAAVQAFANPEASFVDLANALQKSLDYYGHHHLMGNISGNQDRARFISYASGDVRFDEDAKKAGWTRTIGISNPSAYNKLAMLQAFNMSIPGIPCIYYGDEYGSIGGNDPDNRKMMNFNLNAFEQNLKKQVTNLVNTRRNSMALQYGATKIVKAEKDVLIINRTYFNEKVTLIFNKGTIPVKYEGATAQPNNFKMIIKK